MFPDTFLRAARLAFLTWRSPVVCVIALRSHCIAPGASHFTPAAVVSFGNVADVSAVLVERTSSSKVSSPLAVYPPVPANPVSSGKDSAVRAVLALMLIDAAVMRFGVVRVVTVVQGCRLCVLVEDDVHAVELAVAVHRDAAVGGAIAALFEIRHATRRGACGTLTVDGVDGDGRERKGDEREKRHARHGAWRRRSGHARAFYWRHSSDEDHEARVKKSELGDEQL
jgi:hypothetical protein